MKLDRRRPKIFYIFIDMVLMSITSFAAYIFYYNPAGNFSAEGLSIWYRYLFFPYSDDYLTIFTVQIFITIFIFSSYRLYHTTREWSYMEEAIVIIQALLWSILPTAGAIFFVKAKIFSRWIFVVTFLLNVFSLISWRVVKRFIIRRYVVKGYHNLQAVIVGTSRTAEYLFNEFQKYPFLGINVVGFLSKGVPLRDEMPKEILGDVNDLEKIIRRHYIDEVYITTPQRNEEFASLVSMAERLGVSLKVVPDHLNFLLSEIKVHSVGVIPMFEYRTRMIHGSEIIIKRIFDLVASSVMLVLLLPVFIFIALRIKINCPGPVFYLSERIGYKGKPFKFFKFRTMVQDADNLKKDLIQKNEKEGPIFKIKNDPRITTFGKTLRKYSLDELPQLWNVFLGQMSLVGPRPPLSEEVLQYHDWQLKRLNIRPGITCLWQVSGRSDLSFDEWMKMDIFYIENWSFWLDIKILLQTLLVVIRGKGAY